MPKEKKILGLRNEFYGNIINIVLFQDCCFIVMDNPRDISVVILNWRLFLLLLKWEINDSFITWARINQEIILEDAVILQINRE